MNKKLVNKLIGVLLSASILLSSSFVYFMPTVASAVNIDEGTSSTTGASGIESGGGKLSGSAGIESGGGEIVAPFAATLNWLGIDGTTVDMGSEENPYDVSSLAYFLDIQNIISDPAADYNKYFQLTTDINLSTAVLDNLYSFGAILSLNPATHDAYSFIHLDGDNHKITNFSPIVTTRATTAIFGYLSFYSTIKNIIFEDCNPQITNAALISSSVLAIRNDGVIEGNSFVNSSLDIDGSVNGFGSETNTFGSIQVYAAHGLAVADNRGTMRNNTVSGSSIFANGHLGVGGLAGANLGTVQNNIITSLTITETAATSGEKYIGGIVGKNLFNVSAGSVTGNSVAGLSITNGSFVGGIVGLNAAGAGMSENTLTGSVSNTQSANASNASFSVRNYAGGIAGDNRGTISASSVKNVGAHPLGSNAYYGGIAARNSGTITTSFASGTVGTGIVGAGGLVAETQTGAAVSGCYALVKIPSGLSNPGALVGGVNAVSTTFTGNYWSSLISGCQTAYSGREKDNFDLSRGITALAVEKNGSDSFAKSALTHSWGSAVFGNPSFELQSGASISMTETATHLELQGGSAANIINNINYTLTISGIGAAGTSVSQSFSLPVVVVDYTPGSVIVSTSNPLLISASAQMSWIQSLKQSNFRLINSLTLSSSWQADSFSGTFDGNGKNITLSTPLFSNVSGTRGSAVTGADTTAGHISDLNLILTSNIGSGIFGTVSGASLENIDLKANGSATLVAADTGRGTLINQVLGNTYLYKCYTDVPVSITTDDQSAIGGLIGDARNENHKITIDNCGSSSRVTASPAITGIAVASFIGAVRGAAGSEIKNSYSTGFVQNSKNIAIGSITGTGITFSNNYWSYDNVAQSPAQPTGNSTANASFIKWKFGSLSDTSDPMGYVAPPLSEPSTVEITLPSMDIISAASASEFVFEYSETGKIEAEISGISGSLISVELNNLSLASGSVELTIIHTASNLKARITVSVGLSQQGDYYLIQTPENLAYISANQARFLASKFKLCADIDMEGVAYTKIGTKAAPFTGEFISYNENVQYTISNLSITSATEATGMFAYLSGATVKDFRLENASITGKKYLGTLAGGAENSIISNIDIVGGSVISSETVIASSSYTGGLVGGAVNSTISNINVSGSTIKCSSATRVLIAVGGVVGQVNESAADTTTITGVTVDSVTFGTFGNLGGVAGKVIGKIVLDSAVVNNVELVSSGRDGFSGGLLGLAELSTADSVISNSTLSNSTITNSTSTTGSFSGGMVSQFNGTVEACNVENSSISAIMSGGIVASTTGVLTVRNCVINGGSEISSTSTTSSTSNVGGIYAGTATGAAGNLIFENCLIENGAVITGPASTGGIVGRANADVASLTITNCQSFATVSATLTTTNAQAGGIAGTTQLVANNIKIKDCVVGGSITSGSRAAGIIGYHSNGTAFTPSAGGYFIKDSYILASIYAETAANRAVVMLWTIGFRAGFTAAGTHLDQAYSGIIYSSHYEPAGMNLIPYSAANLYVTGAVSSTFIDVNKPDGTNYINGNTTGITISGLVSITENIAFASGAKTAITNNGLSQIDSSSAYWSTSSSRRMVLEDGTVDIDGFYPGTITARSDGTAKAITQLQLNRADHSLLGTNNEKVVFEVSVPVEIVEVGDEVLPGSGTENDPFLIETIADLNLVRRQAPGCYYKLVNDIEYTQAMFDGTDETYADDFAGGFEALHSWQSSAGVPFSGHFDGNGKTLSGFKIKNTTAIASGISLASDRYFGLFAAVSADSSFSSLTLDGFSVTGSGSTEHYVGVLAGEALNTQITNVTIKNSTASTASSATSYAGAVAAVFTGSITNGRIENCVLRAYSGAGGAVGYVPAEISANYATPQNGITISCLSVGGATTITANNAGGFVGTISGLQTSRISGTSTVNSVIESEVSIRGSANAGGFVGNVPNSSTYTVPLEITEAKTFATVVSSSGSAGGAVGRYDGIQLFKITKGVLSGSVTSNGTVTNGAGGIIGLVAASGGATAITDKTLALNTVLSAKISGVSAAGVLLGNFTSNAAALGFFPFEGGSITYSAMPFTGVYYSSYQSKELPLYGGAAEALNRNSIMLGIDSGMVRHIFDLNENFLYELEDETLTKQVNLISEMNVQFQSGDNPKLPTDCNISGTNPDYNAFSASNIFFRLLEIVSADSEKNLFNVDFSGGIHTLSADEEGVGSIVFRYENGIELSLNIMTLVIIGEGTSESPYEISKVPHFDFVRFFPNKYYIQTADIPFTAEEAAAFTPIAFSGSYNGNNKAISGFGKDFGSTSNNVGFFSSMAGSVNNLTIELGANVSGGANVGVLAGEIGSNATVLNITINLSGKTVNAASSTGYAGALSGNVGNGATVTGVSVNSGAVTGTVNIGGITGAVGSGATFSGNSVSNLAVGTDSSQSAGGIAGTTASNITDCRAENVTVKGLAAGGITSSIQGASLITISGCRVLGTSVIGGVTSSVAGGIIAQIGFFTDNGAEYRKLKLESCSVSSETSVNANNAAGGIAGRFRGRRQSTENFDTLEILTCVSYAAVNSTRAGGILGDVAANGGADSWPAAIGNLKITNSAGAGTVQATGISAAAGGIIGYVNIGSASKEDYGAATGFITNSISGAKLISTGNKGKLVGTMREADLKDPNAFNEVFSGNLHSSAGNSAEAFGNAALNSNPGLTNSVYYDMNSAGALSFRRGGTQDAFSSTILIPYTSESGESETISFDTRILAGSSITGESERTDLSDMNDDFAHGNLRFSMIINNLMGEGYERLSSDEENFTISSPELESGYVPGADSKVTLNVLEPSGVMADNIYVGIGFGLNLSAKIISVEIEGEGTSDQPYIIETVEHLSVVRYLPDKHFIQANDITISQNEYAQTYMDGETEREGLFYNEGTGFAPIGGENSPFTGVYNGDGYAIKNLYINNPNVNYIGMFGNVEKSSEGVATGLYGIHIELSAGGITGKKYVGGLAGYISDGVEVENCSVIYSTVAGTDTVGGLIGTSESTIEGCFTSSDVYASASSASVVGGLVGHLYNNNANNISADILSSFSSSNVAGRGNVGGFAGKVSKATGSNVSESMAVTNAFFTGTAIDKSAANRPILIGHSGAPDNVMLEISNVYVAGANLSFNSGAAIVYSGTINAASSNIFFDSTILGATGGAFAAKTNAELTNGSNLFGSGWNYAAGSYPALEMMDDYSSAYAHLAAVPLSLEAEEISGEKTLATGAVFPVSVQKNVGGNTLQIASVSKFDLTDTVTYPTSYDTHLQGNGSDRQTDLLIETKTDSFKIYRNIFANTESYPASASQAKTDGRLFYNFRAPQFTISSTIGGFSFERNMTVPLAYGANNFYIATERQLRAITDSAENTGKFNLLKNSNNNSNAAVMITADINMCESVLFAPISNFKGTFNGTNKVIDNLSINTIAANGAAGLFTQLEGTNEKVISITNVKLSNVDIKGYEHVGALAGKTNKFVAVSGCAVRGGSVGNSEAGYVGGLVGHAEGGVFGYNGYTPNVNGIRPPSGGDSVVSGYENSSSANVQGQNVAGGLFGYSSAYIINSFATGSVTGSLNNSVAGERGIGGFTGIMADGSLEYAFATGDVSVSIASAATANIGVGGFAGIMKVAAKDAFASGAVNVNTAVLPTTGTFGVGGFAGINSGAMLGVYSSSDVKVNCGSSYPQGSSSQMYGVGGVAGVSTAAFSNSYFSGSIERTPGLEANSPGSYFGLGGVVGTVGSFGTDGYNSIYFDLSNTIYSDNLTAIGGHEDNAGNKVRGATTEELCNDNNNNLLDSAYWGFNNLAYPYLNKMFREGVSEYIRYPAALSIAAVVSSGRDASAKAGKGLTMAVIAPAEVTINGIKYEYSWSASPTSEASYIEGTTTLNGATAKTFTPVRTANNTQILTLLVQVKGYETYGERTINKVCAEMLGTAENPYLISNKADLAHVGMAAAGAEPGFDNFYNWWYTPISISGDLIQPVQGKVHFRVVNDVDMIADIYFYSNNEGKLKVKVYSSGYDNSGHGLNTGETGLVFYDDQFVISCEGLIGNSIQNYAGIQLDGNNFSIKNYNKTAGANAFIFNELDSLSEIKDLLLEEISLMGTNSAALVGRNEGTINSVLLLSNCSISGSVNAGGVAALNAGTITKSASLAFVSGSGAVGGLVGTNAAQGNINDSFTMGSVTSTGAGSSSGGFVGTNAGTISTSYSRAAVTASGGYSGQFAGANSEKIQNSYSAGAFTKTGGVTTANLFAGNGGGTLTNTFADKALAGKGSAGIFFGASRTEELIEMDVTDISAFTSQAASNAYPELASISALPETENGELLRKNILLKLNARVSTATVNTQYSQFVDTITLSSTSVLSSSFDWLIGEAALEQASITHSSAGAVNLKARVSDTSSGLSAELQLPLYVGAQNPEFASGNGMSATPYQIGNSAHFDALSYYGPDASDAGGIHYILNTDISYSGGKPACPISVFAGTLNGNQKTVYDFTIDNNTGLFGEITGKVKNLGLVGGKVTSNLSEMGLLAGRVTGAEIENCYAIGEIDYTGTGENAASVGGLVGIANNSTISGILTSGKFTLEDSNAQSAVGGIVGYAALSEIADCISTAHVYADNSGSESALAAGGMAGISDETEISNSIFAGMVTENNGGENNLDAIAGNTANNSTITGCYYDRQLAITGSENAESKSTFELSSSQFGESWASAGGQCYAVPAGLTGSSGKFLSGLQFAAMQVRFLVGASEGAYNSFTRAVLPSATNSDNVSIKVSTPVGTPPGVPNISSDASQISVINNSNEPLSASFEITLDTLGSSATTNAIVRYLDTYLARIVKVNYKVVNADLSDTDINSKNLAAQLRNVIDVAGTKSTYSSEAFDKISGSPLKTFEDIIVGYGAGDSESPYGVFADMKLPKDYTFTVSAVDDNSNELATYDNKIVLGNDTTEITITYTVEKQEHWGVRAFWDNLAN